MANIKVNIKLRDSAQKFGRAVIRLRNYTRPVWARYNRRIDNQWVAGVLFQCVGYSSVSLGRGSLNPRIREHVEEHGSTAHGSDHAPELSTATVSRFHAPSVATPDRRPVRVVHGGVVEGDV